MFGCAFAFRSQLALVVALCLLCGDAFIVALAVSMYRSLYRVRLDFLNRQISVSDRSGLNEGSHWTGDFQRIEDMVQTRDGLRLIWDNGEPGPMLLMPSEEADRIRLRLLKH